MLRFKVLASVVPLLVAATFAGIEAYPTARPCIAVGDQTFEIASALGHADLRVSFTDDPSRATVRVAVIDNAAEADFAVIDDVDSGDGNACPATSGTQFVAVLSEPGAAAPVIYLSSGGPADYRIFVKSAYVTPRQAAALIVGAHGERPHLAAL